MAFKFKQRRGAAYIRAFIQISLHFLTRFVSNSNLLDVPLCNYLFSWLYFVVEVLFIAVFLRVGAFARNAPSERYIIMRGIFYSSFDVYRFIAGSHTLRRRVRLASITLQTTRLLLPVTVFTSTLSVTTPTRSALYGCTSSGAAPARL